MADLRIKTGVSAVLHGNSDGTMVDVRGTRDGAMFTAPWLTALALEGRCFGVNISVGSSPTTFNATWLVTEPDFLLTVPSGTTIIPTYIEVCREDTGGSPAKCQVYACLSSVYDASTTDSDEIIYNMRTDAPRKSLCQAVSVVTSATATTPYTGNFLEFWRGSAGITEDGFDNTTAQTSELDSKTSWCVGEALVPPVIVGEGSLSIWASTVAGKGWITVIWAEVPSNSIKDVD